MKYQSPEMQISFYPRDVVTSSIDVADNNEIAVNFEGFDFEERR